MQLSVIVPCYDAERTLGEQLEALAGQTWSGDWEVIIADNGPPRARGALEALLGRYRERLPNLRRVEAAARRGAGHARNEGARAARGALLAFVDADDVVAEGWLEAVAAALGAHDFVASRHGFERLNSAQTLASRHNEQSEGLQGYYYPPFLPHAGGCGLAIKRTLHEAVGGFDESFLRLQDTDYCWRVQLAGTPLVFAPAALVHVRYRSSAKSILRQARENGEANVHLHKTYRARGMPPLSLRQGLFAWLGILRTLPHLADPERRGHWLWQFGWRLGRLRGSLTYRIVSL